MRLSSARVHWPSVGAGLGATTTTGAATTVRLSVCEVIAVGTLLPVTVTTTETGAVVGAVGMPEVTREILEHMNKVVPWAY